MSKTTEMDGLFPLPLESVWRLLSHHMDEERIREIHPSILSGRVIREGPIVVYEGLQFPREKSAFREVRIAGRRTKATFLYRIEPPRRFGYEMQLQNGSMVQLDNAYSSARGGTHVKTITEVSIKGLPNRVATWVVARSLNRADREDLAYARSKGL
ncbi:MAG TPA: hypothetical protein VJP06_03715 [Thermoplasmata archaeon]|nr:hypothetical protein [Thermoplasmata archaeon]